MSITRGVARAVSLYERAPIRQLLDIDPIGALDWIVVAAGRRLVWALDARSAAVLLDGPERSSGWCGNLAFIAVWAALAGGAITAFA